MQAFETNELVVTCDFCGRFYAKCCAHPSETCHLNQIVYTDGACRNNGKDGAASGIGIAVGLPDDVCQHQWALPVDDNLDPGKKRTNQRAELLASLEGLKKVCELDAEGIAGCMEQGGYEDDTDVIVIATDSEYVVKGMTEWVPAWKQRGWRKSGGGKPFNLDLFRKLDEEVEARERRHACRVKFWYIPRKYNGLADALAKRGALSAANSAVAVTSVAHQLSAWSL
ncbi:ribonuclease H-like domain-containing protein [Phlebopus sp. FC_14]|nr:ribonuclease H-like domain-containing protein [Phlebopus sp. FC_14]